MAGAAILGYICLTGSVATPGGLVFQAGNSIVTQLPLHRCLLLASGKNIGLS